MKAVYLGRGIPGRQPGRQDVDVCRGVRWFDCEKAMPIDPQVQVFLDQLKALGALPLHSLTPQQARPVVVADSRILGDPEPVGRAEDRKIRGPAGEIPIRIYTPSGAGPFGVLVYYHGGGWVVCDIETHNNLCCSIANQAECIVVSVEYRLAPEHKYPAAVEDAYAAAEWVFDCAGTLGGDSRRIALGGDSAGGNLAAVVALKARDKAAFRPSLQVLIYPVTDFGFHTPSYHANAEGFMLTREDMKWFWGHYLDREEQGAEPCASPLRAGDLGNLPPALVITAEYDPLCDEGEAYAGRLREAGVPVVLSRYEGVIHGFVRHTAQFDQAKMAVGEIAAALRGMAARGDREE